MSPRLNRARAETGSNQGDSPLEFRALVAGEGAQLVACLRRCYGESHVDPSLYDAAAIDSALREGRRYAAVAVTPEGEVVGHIGAVFRRIGDNTADAGLTLVDPRFRGRGIAHRLSLEIGRVAQSLGLLGVHDYPVTVHGATQRLAADHALTVGLLLDNMPADVEFNAMDSAGNGDATASLVRYMALAEAPARRVYPPEAYRHMAEQVYTAGGLRREVATSDGEFADGGPAIRTRFELHGDDRRGVLKVTVAERSSPTALLEGEVMAEAAKFRVAQVDLGLCDSHTPAVARQLRKLGFFFGALLPEFADGDVLRLQRPTRASATRSVPVLETKAMRELAEFVQQDAAEVSRIR